MNQNAMRIIEICKMILQDENCFVEAIREIKNLDFMEYKDDQGFVRTKNLIPDSVVSNFFTLLEDETDTIPKGAKRKFCSKTFLEEKDKEEKEIIEFYREDVKEKALKTIELLKTTT